MEDVVDAVPHLLTGLFPLDQLSEGPVVVGVDVPRMGHNGEPDGLRIQCFRGRRATDPAAGLAARMQSNLPASAAGQAGNAARTAAAKAAV